MAKYAKLILKTKSRMTDRLYTYKVPEDMEVEIGQRVMVNFGKGNKKVVGLVAQFTQDISKDIEYKEISCLIESYPILNQELVDIGFFMADKYLSDLSSAINTVLPPGDLVKITETFKAKEELDEITRFLAKPRTFEEISQVFKDLTRKDLKKLIDEGRIFTRILFTRDASIKKVKLVKLVSKDFDLVTKGAKKQREILAYLLNLGPEPVGQARLLKDTGASLGSLKSLEAKGIIKLYEEEVFREVINKSIGAYDKHRLNESQARAFKKITSSQAETFLLKGVTGSGKTEVYLHLVEKAIKEKKQAIVLVPEISLTPQTINRFAGRFGDRVAVLHSKLSSSERFDQWRMIKDGHYDIVVGTRSAIFAPFTRLGIIIIDEEHELSYINEKNPKYDAIDVAEYRAKFHKCNLVLGSATPRVESYYKAQEGQYKLIELKERVSDKALPQVHKVDMREELKNGNFSMFSSALDLRINQALEDGKQTILFLNKRGHTSHIFCRSCGYVQKCEACDSSMTYHRTKNICICHLCGRTEAKSLICPKCGSNAIKEFGAGTQKLEEATRIQFPEARVFRMDADTMGKKGSYEKIYSMMEAKEVDILIGTQMISKGFDFKDVDVVGIMSADLSLNVPDYRAGEKTFQLITQVAGRAGRGLAKGEVYIQTYQPDNYAIRASQNHDYDAFYKKEIDLRKNLHYPPFYDLILIRISNSNRNLAFKRAYEISQMLGRKSGRMDVEIIGPNPAVIEKINNMYRFNILVKTRNSLEPIKKIIDESIIKNAAYNSGGYRYFVMVDPINI